MKKILYSFLLSLCLCVAAIGVAHAYTFAGSWHVGDGPAASSNPQCYSGIEAAALLFGGSPSDYVISTASSDPNLINFKAYMDGNGDMSYLVFPADQDFKLQTGTGYLDAPAFSAYVLDNTEFARYIDPSLTGDQLGDTYVNYAFRIDDAAPVPEPGTLALLASGFGGLAVFGRRRRS
jgi:hypothetical protein